MPLAPTTTFLALFAEESEASLPSGDAAISAALDAYGAKYAKGPSKKSKELREETLAGLSWLHLNHEDVASALRRNAAASRIRTNNSSPPPWDWTTPPSQASRND